MYYSQYTIDNKKFPTRVLQRETIYIHIFICATEVNLLASNHL